MPCCGAATSWLGFGTAQFAFLFLAMALGLPTGLASLVLQAQAPFTVLLSVCLLGERLSRRSTLGVCTAVAGLTVIAVSHWLVAPVLPLVLCLFGALGWAVGNLCSRKAEVTQPMRFLLWMSVVPPLPMFALCCLVEGPQAIGAALAASVTPAGWPGLAALGYVVVCATVLGSGIWTALLARYPAATVAPFSLLVPVVGIGLAFLLLGERPSPLELVVGAVTVLGVLVSIPRATPMGEAAGAPRCPPPGPAMTGPVRR